jgi:hypothetical protein
MKTKVKLVKFIVKFIVNVPEYWIETAYDYHEFESVKYDYKKFGINVKYEEVGFYNGGYNAVFWVGKKRMRGIKENKIKN